MAGMAADDERAITEVVEGFLRASEMGDVDATLALLADDVVFLTPGNEPFGKPEFEAANRGRTVAVSATSEIEEIEVAGDWAWLRSRLSVTMTPPGGEPSTRRGHTLTVLRKEPDGHWVIARDANLLPPPPA
jgi:uncharacterized protein (TIGR02246 family)